jgi:hypothetical protein
VDGGERRYQCPKGHEVEQGHNFCGDCGGRASWVQGGAGGEGRAQSTAAMGGDWLATLSRRGYLYVACGVLAVVVIVLLIVHPWSTSETLSYRDGFAAGVQAVDDGDSPASDYCNVGSASIVMPQGDNTGQWVSGCLAGFQHENFIGDHPGAGPGDSGAAGNSGDTGSTGDTGDTGATGGDTGSTGDTGSNGDTGSTGSDSTTTTSIPTYPFTGTGFAGVEGALAKHQLSVGGPDATPVPGSLACSTSRPDVPGGEVALCNGSAQNSENIWAFVTEGSSSSDDTVLSTTLGSCKSLTQGEIAAVEAFERSGACTTPWGMPESPHLDSITAPTTVQNESQTRFEAAKPLYRRIFRCVGAAGYPVMAIDPQNPNWGVWDWQANLAPCPPVGGLAHKVAGVWKVVSGPAFDLSCGAPTTVPKSVLMEVGASASCPPTPTRIAAGV